MIGEYLYIYIYLIVLSAVVPQPITVYISAKLFDFSSIVIGKHTGAIASKKSFGSFNWKCLNGFIPLLGH